MGCLKIWSVIGMSHSQVPFGRNYFICVELNYTLAQHIIHNQTGKRKSPIEQWRCICGVPQVHNPTNSVIGFQGQNSAITRATTPHSRPHQLKLSMGDHRHNYCLIFLEILPLKLRMSFSMLQILRDNLQEAQNRMKDRYDQSHRPLEFNIGDKVLLHLQPYH